jgi:hypothetical protein
VRHSLNVRRKLTRSTFENWPARLIIILWLYLTVTYRQEFNVFAPATNMLRNFGLWPLAETVTTVASWMELPWGR